MGKVLIIAEAGVNHNGNLELAKKMAQTAKECGADVVKFQTAKLSSLVTKFAGMANYQKENLGEAMSQKEMLRKLLLTYEQFEELAAFCQKIGIEFLSTPFDIESVDFLQKLGCRFWKVPSGEITNLPYLRAIAKTGKDVILSTGMCQMKEIQDAKRILQENGAKEITILHCNTQYPTPMEDVNLKAMLTIKKELNVPVGYSDHTQGIEVSIAAAALGAVVIEKHFTLDRSMDGPDHKASIEPEELKKMVSSIRNIEKALGSEEKKVSPSEAENITIARKSIVAAKEIQKGEVFSDENLAVKRPGTGISPMRWDEIIGKAAERTYQIDEMIEI